MTPDRGAALIVATDTYDDERLQALRAPSHDAEALAGVLADPSIGALKVDLALNDPEHLLRRQIARFFADRRNDELLVVYFSCHGLKDDAGRLYLAAVDTDYAHLDATAVPTEFVHRQMAGSRSRRVVLLLDCCYSGAFGSGLLAKAGDEVDVGPRFEGNGRVVITASSALEYAFEGNTPSGDGSRSVFTSALINGLEHGDADLNGDGWVTVGELYDWIKERVWDETPNQRPHKWEFGLAGDLRIARVPPTARAQAKARARRAAPRRIIRTEPLHVATGAAVSGLALSRDARLAVASADGTVRLWEINAGAELLGVKSGAAVLAIAFSPDRRDLLTAAEDNTVRIWSTETGREITNFRLGEKDSTGCAAFTSDGRRVATLVTDGRTFHVRVWETEDGAELCHVTYKVGSYSADAGDGWTRHFAALSPDGRLIITDGGMLSARVWDVESSREALRVSHRWSLNALANAAFSADGRRFATASTSGQCWIWDSESGRELARVGRRGIPIVYQPDGPAEAVAFTSDCDYLAVGHSRGASRNMFPPRVLVWEIKSGNLSASFGYRASVSAVVFSHDGRHLASGSVDSTATVWPLVPGQPAAVG